MNKILNFLTDTIAKIQALLIGLAIELAIGITGSLSFLKTSWANYNPDFFFWCSIIATLITLISIFISVYLYFKSYIPEEKIKAQVKVWMQNASGITNALERATYMKWGLKKS